MADNMVTLRNVTKKYGKYNALTNINISLERGKIYGLIGKNGAGKTTMMRIIAGLSFLSDGEAEVNAKKIGTLIEAPSLNMNMTAKQNIKFYRMLTGEGDDTTDEDILSMVGLEDTGKRKVKDFSLGMRQRLGIAIALLGKPDFIMLDEPVNGLDPVGVVEIRKMIKKLNEDMGTTILISSHNLAELDKTATDFIIVDKGNIKKIINQSQLDEEAAGNLEEYFLSVIGS